MKNKKLIWILSFISVGLGVAFMGAAWILGGTPGFYFDRNGFHSANESLKDTVIEEAKELDPFTSMELELESADLEIAVSDRFAISYCVDGTFGGPVVRVENGKLTFKESEDVRYWVVFGGFGGIGSKTDRSYSVKIEVPKGTALEDLKVESSNGTVKLASIEAGKVSLENEYGDISLGDLSGKQLKIKADNGIVSAKRIHADKVELENEYGRTEVEVLEGGQLQAESENGDFLVEELKMGRAEIINEYGDIQISRASGEKLAVEIENGNFSIGEVEVSQIVAECEYGDVKLGLAKGMEEYSFNLGTEYGRIVLPDGAIEESVGDGMKFQSQNAGAYQISVKCENGDIVIR